MNMHQKTVIFFEKKMKGYFKAMMLSVKIYENILTVYASFLKRSFIDEEVS